MPITPTDKIWMDGELVDWADATVHVLTHTMHYGSGVFEGIRAYPTNRGVAVFRLGDHMRRHVGDRRQPKPTPLLVQHVAEHAVPEALASPGCAERRSQIVSATGR